MKKYISVFVLTLSLVFTSAACGKKAESEPKKETKTTEETKKNAAAEKEKKENAAKTEANTKAEEEKNTAAPADKDNSSASKDNLPKETAKTATGTLEGFSDSHSAEVTLDDGTMQVYQFDETIDPQISKIKEGSKFTFTYAEDPATGVISITSIVS